MQQQGKSCEKHILHTVIEITAIKIVTIHVSGIRKWHQK